MGLRKNCAIMSALVTGVRLLGASLAVLLCSSTASAGAAVTIGGPADHVYFGAEQHLARACSTTDSCTVMQTHAPPGVVLTAPTDGVIVRWRIRAIDTGASLVSLQVLRTAGGNAFVAVNESPQRELPNDNNIFLTFNTRQAVHAGDQIGLKALHGQNLWILGATGNSEFFAAGFDPALGPTPMSQNLVLASGDSESAEFNADLEPDVDHDGFGDETQDQCPTDARKQIPCPPTGRRLAALRRCKRKFPDMKKERRKCRKRAMKKPL